MSKELRVLIVEDSENDTLLLLRELRREGYEPIFERVETREAMIAALEGGRWDIVISDFVMPGFSGLDALCTLMESGLDLPFIIVSGNIGEDIAVSTMKAGAHDYILKDRLARLFPAIERELAEAEVRRKKRIGEEELLKAYAEIKELKDRLQEENVYLKKEIEVIHGHKDIVGNSEAIRRVLRQVEQVAGTDSTVLIQGNTGTGKELMANAIHSLSPRKARSLIKVNCAALPATLIENELFGCEKGAFTGALSRQIGRFEIADGSTIFLDEIDSLSLELQAKLLRVLQSGEFERLGSGKTIKVNVRIIAATNLDLAGAVRNGKFREDLYFRLNIFPITVPPLQERKDDILPLVWSFVKEFGDKMGKRIESIPKKSIEELLAYPWPGNVRELRNIVERAMIISNGSVLPIETPKKSDSLRESIAVTLDEVERLHITQVLNSNGWKVSGRNGAAEILGLNPKTLASRMQKLGIKKK